MNLDFPNSNSKKKVKKSTKYSKNKSHLSVSKSKNQKQSLLLKKRKKRYENLFYFVVFLFFILFFYFLINNMTKPAEIIVQVDNQTILQDENVPALTVSVKINKKANKKLDENYTVKDLSQDLKDEKDLIIVPEVDVSKEGEYPLDLQLDEYLSNKLANDWQKKLNIVQKNGTLLVKNKYGQWDGSFFKNWDGNLVKNQFIVYDGNTYYLNEDAQKTTDWVTIDQNIYYFNDEGIMQTGWVQKDNKKYYLKDDGIASIGWQLIDNKKYYFNENGSMATGMTKIGNVEYRFDDNGMYESAKVVGIDVNKPMIALTFDDGPGPYTQQLLDILQKYNVNATFFMLGLQVPKYPDIVKKMYEQGNELGNHSVNHKDLTTLSSQEIQNEIQGTNNELDKIVNTSATVFRPPYGKLNSEVKQISNVPDILWSIDTLDWKTKNVDAIFNEVIGKVTNGDIVLMHDIYETSVQAVDKMIPALLEQGFQIVTISELAVAKQINLLPGQAIRSFKT